MSRPARPNRLTPGKPAIALSCTKMHRNGVVGGAWAPPATQRWPERSWLPLEGGPWWRLPHATLAGCVVFTDAETA